MRGRRNARCTGRARAAAGALLAAAFVCGVASCRQAPAPSGPAFAAAVHAFVEEACRRRPVWATEIGAHAHDAELDDVSRAGIRRRIAWLRAARRELRRFDPALLGLDDRIDRDILLQHIEGELFELQEVRDWERNPLYYTQLAGNAIHLLTSRDFAPLEVRLESARARLLRLPQLLREARRNLRHPPRVHTEVAMRQNRGVVQLVQHDLRAAAAGSRLEAALGAAADSAAAALDEYQRFLEEDLLRRSDGDFRLGRRRFDRKLRVALQSDLSSQEIRRRAEAERERVLLEMFERARVLHRAFFPDAPPIGDGAGEKQREAVVRAVLERIADDHPRAEDLLVECRASVDSLTRFNAAAGLVRLDPGQSLTVEWTPEFARGVNVAGLDAPGPLDRHLPSFYHVQPIPADWSPQQAESYLREYNRPMLQVLSMHEAVPGHFVQLCRANRCPSLVRRLFPNGAFVEGWAVYGERMMLEAGYMGRDPRLELQQLKFYLRTVLNALLDIGVHCEGMGEQEAIELLTRFGFQEESEARAKWVRAQLSSTQLCTYFVGAQEILDLEAADRARLGAAWSQRDFTDRLLAHGSPPVRHLRTLLAAPATAAGQPAREAAP